MANLVEFIIKARDLVSGPMQRISSVGEGTFSRLTRSSNSFQRSFTRLGSSIDQIEAKLKDLERTRNMSVDSSQIRRINREMQELEGRRNRLTGQSRSGGSGLGGIMGLVGIGSALALGGTVIKAGMERQMAGTAFQVMAGKEKGAALHKDLIKFATDTIYGNEVFGEAKTMLGYGVKSNRIMPALKMFGDVAMGDKEQMKALALAYSQTTSAGRLTGNDMLQYTNTNFNPLTALSEMSGKSMPFLKKQMSEGKISIEDVTKALEYATGPMGRFHDGMKNMGNTSTGKWIAFTGALETLAGTVGMKLLPGLGAVANVLNSILNHETLLYSTAAGIGAMATAWGVYTMWTQRAAFWTNIVNNKVLYGVLGGIGVAIGLITFLTLKFDGWGKSALAVWEITKSFFSDLKIGMVDFAQTVAYVFEVAYYKIKGFFEQISHSWQKIKKGDFTDSPFTTEASKKLSVITQQHAIDVLTNKKGLIANGSAMKSQFGNIGLKWHTDTSEAGPGKSPVDIASGKAGSMPSSMADTNKGISGGGVRNLTINVGNLGTGKIDIHAATVSEGAAEIRRIFEEMFLQVVNSGNAAIA